MGLASLYWLPQCLSVILGMEYDIVLHYKTQVSDMHAKQVDR